MQVKILELRAGELIKAIIKEGGNKKLPSIRDNWVFNFEKYSKLPKAKAYILVHEDAEETIEGCMIFSMHETYGPFMSYLEVAPHNKGIKGKYKYVAGCLIAYACGLSFENGVRENKGILTFLAFSDTAEMTKKLEALYRKKYGAIKNPFGFMEIYQNQSKRLMKEYLEREKY